MYEDEDIDTEESLSSTSYEESFEDDDDDDDDKGSDGGMTEKQQNETASEHNQIETPKSITTELATRRTTEDESLIQEESASDDDNSSSEEEEEEEVVTPEKEKRSNSIQLSSNCPTEFNEDDYAFHFNFFRKPANIPKINEKKYKNGTRKSLSFSNERMREIERHNRILLSKIVSKGPSTYENHSARNRNFINSNYSLQPRVSSAAINRKKQQKQIDYENQILRRKIEAIATRKPRGVF